MAERDLRKDAETIGAAVAVVGAITGLSARHVATQNVDKAERIIELYLNEYNRLYNECKRMEYDVKDKIDDIVCLKKEIIDESVKKFLDSFKKINPEILLKDNSTDDGNNLMVLKPDDISFLEDCVSIFSNVNRSSTYGNTAFEISVSLVTEGAFSLFGDQILKGVTSTYNDRQISHNFDNAIDVGRKIAATYSIVATQYGVSGITEMIHSKRVVEEVDIQKAEIELKREKLLAKRDEYREILQWGGYYEEVIYNMKPILEKYIDTIYDLIETKYNEYFPPKETTSRQQPKPLYEEYISMSKKYSLLGRISDSFKLMSKKKRIEEPHSYVNKELILESYSEEDTGLNTIGINVFSDNEVELLMFTFSLVHAVKTILETPMLTKEGAIYRGEKFVSFEESKRFIEDSKKKYWKDIDK